MLYSCKCYKTFTTLKLSFLNHPVNDKHVLIWFLLSGGLRPIEQFSGAHVYTARLFSHILRYRQSQQSVPRERLHGGPFRDSRGGARAQHRLQQGGCGEVDC